MTRRNLCCRSCCIHSNSYWLFLLFCFACLVASGASFRFGFVAVAADGVSTATAKTKKEQQQQQQGQSSSSSSSSSSSTTRGSIIDANDDEYEEERMDDDADQLIQKPINQRGDDEKESTTPTFQRFGNDSSSSSTATTQQKPKFSTAAAATSTRQDNEDKSSWLDGLELEHYANNDQNSMDQQQQHHLHELPDHMLQNPLLQVPCSIQVSDVESSSPSSSSSFQLHPIATFVDTGAQVTIMSWKAAQRARLFHLMDRRYAGHAVGVGKCRVLGRIPAGALRLHLHGHDSLASPAITVLDDDDDNDDHHHNQNNNKSNNGVELLLGLDFLRDYQAILDLRQGEMRLLVHKDRKDDVIIPFIIPRSNRATQQHYHNDHRNTPMLQQCKSWIVPLGAMEGESDYDDDRDEDYGLDDDNSNDNIDMSGI